MNYLSSFHFYKKINTEMAKPDAINCGFDVGFPSFLVCCKKPGLFVLKILLPFASVPWKTLLSTEIVSCELDLQVKTYCTHSCWVTLGTAAAKDISFPPAHPLPQEKAAGHSTLHLFWHPCNSCLSAPLAMTCPHELLQRNLKGS